MPSPPTGKVQPPPPKARGVLGAYTKLQQIGQGQFGRVHLCRHTRLGGEKLVAKEILTQGLSAKEVKATLQEVMVLRRVAHPSIIELRDAFGHDHVENGGGDGTIGIITEYCPNGDLGTHIEERAKHGAPFPESTIRTWAQSLASALDYLHQTVLLLHRDIKPSNVFLTRDNNVKLGDFGLSKLLSHAKELAHSQVGTPLYMAPELCAGKPYDRAADVWAFGCTIFEAMSLAPPWAEHILPNGTIDGGLVALYRLIMTADLAVDTLREHFSDPLCDFVGSLVCRKRKVRLRPMSELLDELNAKPAIPASWGLSAAAANALASMEAEEAAARASADAFAALAAVQRQYSIAHGMKPNALESRPPSRPVSNTPSPRSDPTSRSASRPTSRATSRSSSPRTVAHHPRTAARCANAAELTDASTSPATLTPSSVHARSPAGTSPTSPLLTPTSAASGNTAGMPPGDVMSACTRAADAHYRTRANLACGAEYHAAAGILQRSYLRHSNSRAVTIQRAPPSLPAVAPPSAERPQSKPPSSRAPAAKPAPPKTAKAGLRPQAKTSSNAGAPASASAHAPAAAKARPRPAALPRERLMTSAGSAPRPPFKGVAPGQGKVLSAPRAQRQTSARGTAAGPSSRTTKPVRI